MDRIDRISEEVSRELSDIIQNHIKDPRLPPFVSVTGVRVAKDLKHAKAFVSVLGTAEQKQGALKALQSAAGFIRHEIGQRVRLRFTPEFHFEIDDSIEHGMHISKLIADTMAAHIPHVESPKDEEPEDETEAEDEDELDADAEAEDDEAPDAEAEADDNKRADREKGGKSDES